MFFNCLVRVSSHDLLFEEKFLKRACIDEEMFLTEVRVLLLKDFHLHKSAECHIFTWC